MLCGKKVEMLKNKTEGMEISPMLMDQLGQYSKYMHSTKEKLLI